MTGGVLVTAGNKRIGRAISLTLAKAGYHIYLHHHDSADEAENTRRELPSAEVIQCDLGNFSAVEKMMEELATRDIPLRHVVNNASLFTDNCAKDFDEETFTAHMNVNLRGPLQLARGLHHCLEKNEGQDKGSVVNILDSKVFALNADFFTYSLSKYALFGATEMLAQALSPTVRVNGVAPGLTMIAEKQSAENFNLASHMNFVGEPLKVQDLADTVLHLIRTTSLNGCVIPVDGGQKMMNFTRDVVAVAEGILSRS